MPQENSRLSQSPLICLITDGEAVVDNFASKSLHILKLVRSAVTAEVPFIQIREKKIPAKLLFELANQAAKITKDTKSKLFINGRADIAFLAGADGVHLPSDSIPASAIRRSFGASFLIGVSVHSLAEAKAAEGVGADYLTFGPVFRTPSKDRFGEPQGLEKLAELAQDSSVPVIGVGGIDGSNYRAVLDQGAAGFASIRFLGDAERLPKIMKEISAKSDE